MSENQSLRSGYRELVRNAAGFSAQGFEEFVAFAAQYHPYASNEKAEIVDWLSAANRQADLVPLEVLLKDWMPYAYHSRTGEVSWCLPQGRAVQPFHDEYISHCRQYLVNALLSPRISVDKMLRHADALAEIADPAGFIFHLSRCGSTLVSGCLAQLEQCSVLSESPLLTEILLAGNINWEDKKALLRLCLHLQGRPSPEQPLIVVKWNAWDLFHWAMIREIWPNVPVLLLTRDPVEILASHARSAGRHMSGDPGLAHVHDVLGSRATYASPLDYRTQVLRELMTEMARVSDENRVFLLDYAELGESALVEICSRFGIGVSPHQHMELRRRLALNSKSPERTFQADGAEKRCSFPHIYVQQIQDTLSMLHQALIRNSHGFSKNKS